MDIEKIYTYVESSDFDSLCAYIGSLCKNKSDPEKKSIYTSLNSILFYKSRPFEPCKECYDAIQEKILDESFVVEDLACYFEIQNQSGYNRSIEMALKYIDDNLDKDLCLDRVADQVHLSKNYFSNLFKDEIGISYCKYVNMKRIDYAKKLLLNYDYSIDYIGYACGYKSTSHFSTTFSSIVGISPSQYRKNHLS